MNKVVLIIFLYCLNYAHAQNYAELRHVQNDSLKIDFYVSTDHKKIKYKDTVLYTWYKSKKVMTTQGNSSGDILNGTFKKYYLSGQLAESGLYKMGLKTGKWFTWDKDGLLISIENYHKGQLNGKQIQYENGQLIHTDKYKKGTLKHKKNHKEKEDKSTGDEIEKEPFLKRVFKIKDKESSEKTEDKEENKKKWFSKKNNSEKKNKTKKKPKKTKKPKKEEK